MVKIPLLSQIFVWSIIFELLYFFTIPILGQRPAISRFLQVIVLIGLLIKWLRFSRLNDFKIININHPNYRYYSFYFGLVVLAGIIGIFSGAYSVDVDFVNNLNEIAAPRTSISPIENMAIEYLIALYYFVYFVILPRYLFKSEKSVSYFFTCFKFTFIVCLVVGFVDFGFSNFGYTILPTDIARGIARGGDAGVRFHGLAGEPRFAFVYLFLGLAILYLQAHFRGFTLSKWWLLPIILAAIFTKSASGLIGVSLFLVLYGFYGLKYISILQTFKMTALIILVICFIYVSVSTSERTMLYIESASGLWDLLESGMEIPHPISVQMYNIYPIYDLTVKFRDLNLLPILIGSGLGSASVINNNYLSGSYIVSNPQSQLVRLIYEAGLIGTLFFIFSFISPVKYLTKNLPFKKQKEFILITLLLLGCFLGHRTAAGFIYLGAFISAFRVLNNKYTM